MTDEELKRHEEELPGTDLRFTAPWVKQLLADHREAKAILREVEWVEQINGDGDRIGVERCPRCEERKEEGHVSDCPLAKVLGG